MARPKGTGLKRGKPFTLRLDEAEKKELERKSLAVGLSMEGYARCKIYDKPFTDEGGKILKGRTKKAQEK
jgi:hypothetical protein